MIKREIESVGLANQSENNVENGLGHKINKVFGIGLGRTATTSLYYLMKDFGFKAAHHPSSMIEIDDHFFSNDSSVSARFEELDQRYPNSKFIYTTRAVHRWVASFIKRAKIPTRLEEIHSMPAQIKQWYDESDLNLYGYDQLGVATATEEKLIMAYHRHEERVKNYFRERPSDLLTLDLTDRSSRPLTTLIAFLEQNELIRVPKTNSNAEPYFPPWKHQI